ncbi:hypothetical protein OCF52_26600 [Bacillus cereus]|nr:hypothetical protein [Bacillus cereus]
MQNSLRLRSKIELVIPKLVETTDKLYNRSDFVDIYPEYLFTLHSIIRASVPLMKVGLERAQAMVDTDPLANGIVSYLSKHIHEEMYHDDWLLDDLEVLGVNRHDTIQRLPSHTVAEMVGSQYYWIQHHHPVALLGYIAVMEGYPPVVQQINQLIAKTGCPKAAFRTMFKHADLDPHHRDDLNVAIDQLPLSLEHHSILGISAIKTVESANKAMLEVLRFRGKSDSIDFPEAK